MAERGSSQVFKRKELVARLEPVCQRAFKAAADTAKLRGNPYVELVHFIEQLALTDRGDVQLILAEAGVDGSRLTADMTAALDGLPYGATSIQDFSDHVFDAIQEGMSYGSLQARDETVRSAYILLGALKVPVLDGLLGRISREFDKLDPDALGPRLDDVLAGSIEGGGAGAPPRPPAQRRAAAGPGGGQRARQIRDRPHRAGARRQDRPGHRPRPRDPPDRRRADAPPAEQPDPHRRGRRRQDRGGRGLRAAHRRRATCRRCCRTSACACSTSG